MHAPVHHNLRMQVTWQGLVWPHWAALVLSALAAGSAVHWGLKWPASTAATTPESSMGWPVNGADPAVLARALGAASKGTGTSDVRAAPVVVSASSRLSLVGVVANAHQGGAALISVDGKPARPFRVGAQVEGDWRLQSVTPRRAVLAVNAGGTDTVTLELPAFK